MAKKNRTSYLWATIKKTQCNLNFNIDLQLDTTVLKFVHSCLNHCNSMSKSLLSAKLHCIKSTFAAIYKYLSYKYKICQDNWFVNINVLIEKMKVQFKKETQSRSNAHTIVYSKFRYNVLYRS